MGIAACAATFILAPRLEVLYVIMTVFGVAVAFFFPPYMVFMKGVEGDANRHIAGSTALYTLAWSLGLATGPFVAGAVWSWRGWEWVAGLDCLLALATMAGLLLFFRCTAESRPQVTAPEEASGAETRVPDLAWLAWIGSGTCLLAMSMVRGVFPATAHGLSVPKADQGIALALICVGQAVAALGLVRGRTWLYRAGPVAAFGIVGLAGLVLFGLARSSVGFYAATFCFGIYAGAAYVYMAFHALVHPSRAGRNVGVNEAIVGLTGIVGPALAGVLADHISSPAPYYCAAGIVAVALAFQVSVHLRTARV
jgi:predicted MFS family arabinose efflux permease